MIRATKHTNTHPHTNRFRCTETISLSQTHNPSAVTSLSFALLIKSCSNTGCHTSLSFTLAWVHSNGESPLVTSIFCLWLQKSSRRHSCQEVFTSHPWYLSLPPNSHNSTSGRPARAYFHIPRWKVIHLVQCSSVCQRSNLSVLLPAMVFSLPRRTEWIRYPTMTRPQGLLHHAVNTMTAKKKSIALQEELTCSNGETLICCTIV